MATAFVTPATRQRPRIPSRSGKRMRAGVILGPRVPVGGARRRYFLTFTWYPAALSALTSSSASKSPVTSNVSLFALAVFPVTPATLPTAAAIALLHCPQQLWTPSSVRVFTFPLVAPLSSLIFRSLLSVVPWKPPAARASSAFWAVSASFAVMVIVPAFWSHLPVTPSTFLRMAPTAVTHWPQHRCVFFNSTVVSAP